MRACASSLVEAFQSVPCRPEEEQTSLRRGAVTQPSKGQTALQIAVRPKRFGELLEGLPGIGSSKASKPGALDTRPAREAKRLANSSKRSRGTVIALTLTTLTGGAYGSPFATGLWARPWLSWPLRRSSRRVPGPSVTADGPRMTDRRSPLSGSGPVMADRGGPPLGAPPCESPPQATAARARHSAESQQGREVELWWRSRRNPRSPVFLDSETNEDVLTAAPERTSPRGEQRPRNVLLAPDDFQAVAHSASGRAGVIRRAGGDNVLT